MLKVYYRQKFRVRNVLTKRIERLNQSVDINGRDIWIEGFDSLDECQKELERYLLFNPKYRPYLKIETYTDKQPMYKNIPKELHPALKAMHAFSGKGLAENAAIPKREENKYQHGRYYSKEINFAASVDRNKGLSLIHKLKDKVRNRNVVDTITFMRVCQTDTSFVERTDVALKVRELVNNGTLPDRKACKAWLKERGYTVKQQRNILHRTFN